VSWVINYEIILGYPGGIFKPDSLITYKEVVTILYLYTKNYSHHPMITF